MIMPTNSQHIMILGKNGTGKTTEALWHLSQRDFDRPWIIIDFKRDELVNSLPVTALASIEDKPPSDPGLYVVHATWQHAEPRGRLEKYFYEIMDQKRTGILIDEGQRIGQHNPGFRTVLFEGRQPEVCMIYLTQRPSFIDTVAMSEPAFFQIFMLQHIDHWRRLWEVIEEERLDPARLREAGDHHSYYWDSNHDTLEILAPCPAFPVIYDRILTVLPRYQDAASEPLPRRIRV